MPNERSGPVAGETDSPALSPAQQEIQTLLTDGYTILDRLGELDPATAIGQCDAALSLFKRARELTGELPTDELNFNLTVRRAIADAFSQRGHQQRYLYNHADALADLSQSLKLNPDRAEDYYYRAQSHLAKSNLAQARADFTEYLKRGNNDYLRDQAKAAISSMVPGKDDAKASLEHWYLEGLRLNSEANNIANPAGENVSADWPKTVARYNQAIEAFDRALEANSNHMMSKIGLIRALLDQAEGYRHMDEYDLALQNYDRAQQIRPNLRHLFLRAETLLEAGHPNLARPIFEDYLANGDEPALRVQAQEYLASKKMRQATN